MTLESNGAPDRHEAVTSIGADEGDLASIVLSAWETGYHEAQRDIYALRLKRGSRCEAAANAACALALEVFAPADECTFHIAYLHGWLGGYTARQRGDVWVKGNRGWPYD